MLSSNDLKDFFLDVLQIIYLFLLNFVYTFKTLVIAYLLPKSFVEKCVKGDVVLITGAGAF